MYSDEQLMQRYATGDQSAFRALHVRYRPLIERVVRRHVFRDADVEDLVQQTFMQLHAARASYRVGEPVRPWLCTMAVNLCRDYGRRCKRRPESGYEMDTLSGDVASLLPSELRQVAAPLEAALASLSAVTQRIFHEHFVAERALVEIARDMNANPATVRVRMHRGCAQLRAALAE